MQSCTLHLPQLERSIAAADGETIFQAARRQGVRILGACGGRGTCGSCMVRVSPGAPGSAPARQRKWERACLHHPAGECRVEIAPRSLAPVMRPDAAAAGEFALEPVVRSFELQRPHVEDFASAADAVREELGNSAAAFDLQALRELDALLAPCNPRAAALHARVRGEEVLSIAPASCPTLGLAIELGTASITGFLRNLDSGAALGSLELANPQARWAEGLPERIALAGHADGAERLRQAAADAVNAIARELCRAAGHAPHDIVDAVIGGNTVLHHLLLGLPVRTLADATPLAAERAALDVKARELGLEIHPAAWVHLAPNVGGWVGGDHVATLLATERDWVQPRTTLLLDIGAITALALLHEGTLHSACVPGTAALEAEGLSCGMRAADGAIEAVQAGENGALRVRTVGRKAAVGLCASGLIDAVAVAHASARMDRDGKIVARAPDTAARIELTREVFLTQADIDAVLRAKARVRAGVDLLLRQAGAPTLGAVVVARSSQPPMPLASALRIGLLPSLAPERIVQAGNAAARGLQMMLCSRWSRQRAWTIAVRAKPVQVVAHPEFESLARRHVGVPSAQP